MKKDKGLTIYLILYFIIGVFTIISVPYSFKMGKIELILPIFLIIMLIILGKIIKKYNNIIEFYNIAYYLVDERQEFARVIHDDIIQDIYGAINYLNLKNPDVNESKEILKELEMKTRSIMNFYQNNFLDNLTIEENFNTILFNLKKLHPEKDLDITLNISNDAYEYINDKNLLRIILVISKELLNNIYKHSNASYVKYSLTPYDNGVYIQVENDKARKEDIINLKNSKRGILFIKALVHSDGGSIDFVLNKEVLITKLYIKGENQ